METTSSLPKSVLILRWVARVLGSLLVVFIVSQFMGEFLRKGFINVAHPGHYVLFAVIGLAQIGILLAWRWEGIGGFLAVFGIIAFDLLNIFWVQSQKMIASIVGLSIWLIPAFLFIYCWWKSKEES